MNTNDPDRIWKNLLAKSAPTFAAEPHAPYGFVTKVVSGLRAENRQQREVERLGLRALGAALATLGVAAVVTIAVNLQQDKNDFDPGVRSLVQLDNLPYS